MSDPPDGLNVLSVSSVRLQAGTPVSTRCHSKRGQQVKLSMIRVLLAISFSW